MKTILLRVFVRLVFASTFTAQFVSAAETLPLAEQGRALVPIVISAKASEHTQAFQRFAASAANRSNLTSRPAPLRGIATAPPRNGRSRTPRKKSSPAARSSSTASSTNSR